MSVDVDAAIQDAMKAADIAISEKEARLAALRQKRLQRSQEQADFPELWEIPPRRADRERRSDSAPARPASADSLRRSHRAQSSNSTAAGVPGNRTNEQKIAGSQSAMSPPSRADSASPDAVPPPDAVPRRHSADASPRRRVSKTAATTAAILSSIKPNAARRALESIKQQHKRHSSLDPRATSVAIEQKSDALGSRDRAQSEVIPSSATCGSCGATRLGSGAVGCLQCDVVFCKDCDAIVHRNAMTKHKRVSVSEAQVKWRSRISNFCPIPAHYAQEIPLTQYCVQCHQPVCSACVLAAEASQKHGSPHIGHTFQPLGEAVTEERALLQNCIEPLRTLCARMELDLVESQETLQHVRKGISTVEESLVLASRSPVEFFHKLPSIKTSLARLVAAAADNDNLEKRGASPLPPIIE